MRANEFIHRQLREDIEDFPIANVRKANGAIGNQGVNIEQAADVLTHAAGMQVSPDMSMRQLVDALKADPAAQQRLRQFVQKNPVTVYALPDGSYHLQDGHHRTFLLNLLGDETVPAIVKEDVTEAKTVEFEGLTLKVIKQGHELTVDALDEWGNKVLGHVKFNIGDGRELDPQDLRVDDKYQGQGIARVMYDYVKSLGYTINRSWDQTDAGAGFWNKHRGEDVRVWEQDVAEARTNPDKNIKRWAGKLDLAAFAETIKDKENWGVSMTVEPKLGINPRVGISEDTPKGIYFYPLEYFIHMVSRYTSLPWGDNMPYMQLFQYDRSGEMTRQTQVDPAQLKQALSQYCPEEIIQQVIDEPDSLYDGTPYWIIYDCLSRLGKSDETNIIRWNKVLRDLGFTSVFDPGRGWIATGEPTQGIILDPRIIKQHKTFINRNPTILHRKYDINRLADAINWSDYYNSESQRQQVPYGHPDRQKTMLAVANNMLRPFLGKTSEEAKEMGLDQALKTASDKVIEILKQDAVQENFADGKNPGRKEIDPDVYEDLSNSIIARTARQIVPTIRAKSTPEGYVYLSTQDGLSLVIGCNIAGGSIDINIGSQPMETTSSGPHKGAVSKIIEAVYQAAAKQYGAPIKQGTLSIDHDAGHGVWQHIAQKLGLQHDAHMVKENFADGKNPGRKGLSKRVGVNTKASVSSLRKTAKNSSGEKQRMAHWLANMKAGRAKARRK
jgi:GNAT superfamily N-acetyltransferase